jgi:hypothetical protein
MALLNFHYLITGYGLTVWTHAPATILAIIWATQAIMFIAGITVADFDDFIFWNFLSTFVGVVVGVGLLLVTRAPRMLRLRASYIGTWGQFILWVAAFLAAQLFYGFFPPPTYPWGILGTSVAHLLIHVVLWVVMYYNPVMFKLYTGRRYFFLLWIVVQLLMEVLFFVAYALSERNTTYVAAGAGAAVLIVMALVFPMKIPYRESSIVGGESLIHNPGDGPVDGEDDN